ncbi:MAG: DUF3352 domain-containing protein [Chroococcidiopsidaceae cyanobacterium CP_BM_ER_R8_30]|nr:DUF3352 domain-containing protein [Chroococcidiopsidaceae cyanobacterium CP_BM_ER_R8_30]
MIAKHKSSLLLTLSVTGLLIGGGIVAYWVLSQRNSSPQALPMGANIIPQDALVTVSISTDPAKWEHLREFGTKATQAELDRELTQLREQFLTNNGYDYQEDVQPWVGQEVTLAVLPQPAPTPGTVPPPPGTSQQSVMAVLPIADPVRAKQLLEDPKPLKQSQWTKRTYKGVQIEQSQGASDYSATVLDGRFLVVTNNPKAVEQAIDTDKSGTSIATTPGFTAALEQIQASQPFAQLYLNIPAAVRFMAANSGQSIFPQTLTQLQENQGLATTVTLKQEGIELQSISWLQPNSSQKHLVENNAGGMPSRFPADTLMMLSGGDLQQLWQDYFLSSSNSKAPIAPANLQAGVNSLTGLDLDRDFLSWMKGPFSLSLIPSAPKANVPNNFALALGLMVQTNDRAQAEKTFQKLDQLMSSRYQFNVQPAKINGQPVVKWVAPYGTLTATHGWLDGNVAFLTVGAPIAEQIVPNPGTNTLASSALFQKTVPPQPNPNNGQVFIDMDRLLKTFPGIQSLQQPYIDAIRSIGITTAVSDERSIHYNAFVSLKNAGEPDPLPSPTTSP